MRNFRGIEFEVIKRFDYGRSGDVYIDLESVNRLATDVLYDGAVNVEDYIIKLKRLCDDIEDLGKMIYEEDPDIYFGYYQGISDVNDMFAFGVGHRTVKDSSYKYSHIFTKVQIQRALKINNILDK